MSENIPFYARSYPSANHNHDDKNKSKSSIHLTIPGWIIENTRKCLDEKEKRIDDLLRMRRKIMLKNCVPLNDPATTPLNNNTRGRFSTEKKPRKLTESIR